MKTIFKERAWYRMPFIRITIALIAGIILGNYFLVPILVLRFGIGNGIILLIGFHLLLPSFKFRYNWIGGFLIHIIFIGLGWMLLLTEKKEPLLPNERPLLLSITAPLINNKQSLKTIGKIGKIKVTLYFKKDSAALTIKMGTQIAIWKNPDSIVANHNPGAFNYKAYAASQQIFYQCYLTTKDYQIIAFNTPSYKEQFIITLHNILLHTIQQYVTGAKEKAIAEALLIGYKKNLDPELLQAYSNTGVVHIIAISGMHLGMIYGLLLFLLKPVSKTRTGNWLRLMIMLLIIWTFTLLTGAAASILRSAIMFSFIIIGQLYQKKSPIYNSIAASAFCILLYNPLQLWDIGFQLSYAAVISIVTFSKPISCLLFLENKLLRYSWQLTAVNISAQIGTIPLLLFYFHQFPNLFIFANFIAVPLSGLILYMTILLVLIAPISPIAKFVGELTGFLINCMNSVIENSARIPFAVTQNIQIDLTQTILLFAIIIFIAIWFMKKNKPAVFGALICLVFFSAIQAISKINTSIQYKLIVYNFPKKTAIDIIEGTKHCFIGDMSAYQNPFQVKNYLSPTRILYRANTAEDLLSLKFHNHLSSLPIILGPNKVVLIVTPKFKLPNYRANHPIDFILFSGNPSISMETLSSYFINAQFVFDASNPMWKIERWKKEAERLHLRHYSVPQKGAFEINL